MEKSGPSQVKLDKEMQDVLSLMMSRTRGEVSDEAVENAVCSMLSRSKTSASQKPSDYGRKKANEHHIVMDNDNYDDLEEDEKQAGNDDESTVPNTEPESENPCSMAQSATKVTKATVESVRKQINDLTEDPYSGIILGKMGSKMMITFGDGRNPKPEAVSAALLGARRCLQMAIKDARALRRQAKMEYLRARAAVKQGKQVLKKPERLLVEGTQEAVNPEMLYRAMSGYDRLSYDPKCGFDIQQLQQLFPEEMNAYERWTQMHNAYVSSKESNSVQSSSGAQAEATDNDGVGENGSMKKVSDGLPLPEGHLTDRLAQFDSRTEQMKNDWYIKFAEVRQGSFLPKRGGRRTSEEREWDTARKQNRKRGRQAPSWEALSAPMIQFLHWVGFDHRSALPPPSEDTTQALGFLAYDFMGRIVEKAIYLRTTANHELSRQKGSSSTDLLLELQDGEQLDAHDVERSLSDTTIRPVPLYSATDDSNSTVAASLYFGPGFENRLEMEMDELVSGKRRKSHLSDAERDTRKKEDELFERLKEPPVLGGYREIMREDKVSEANGATSDPE